MNCDGHILISFGFISSTPWGESKSPEGTGVRINGVVSCPDTGPLGRFRYTNMVVVSSTRRSHRKTRRLKSLHHNTLRIISTIVDLHQVTRIDSFGRSAWQASEYNISRSRQIASANPLAKCSSICIHASIDNDFVTKRQKDRFTTKHLPIVSVSIDSCIVICSSS